MNKKDKEEIENLMRLIQMCSSQLVDSCREIARAKEKEEEGLVLDYDMYGEYVNDKEREIREDIVRISEILDLNL